MKKYDLTQCIVGPIVGFFEDKDSKTGFQVKMLVRDDEKLFDITEEAYQIKYAKEYATYPCIGEVIWLPTFNKDNVIIELDYARKSVRKENAVNTVCIISTSKAFKVKITDKTPQLKDLIKIEGDKVTFSGLDANIKNGYVSVATRAGNIPELKDGNSLNLAADCVVYVWNWAQATTPFERVTREEAEKRNFPTRFHLGSREHLMKNVYWTNFLSTRGNEDEIDLIQCFLNQAPGYIDE